MYLNSIKPGLGAKKNKLRVGRGIGSGLGKTCGRGHKGQKSRAGGFHKTGFEGGQMPIQRRLPKRGFTNINKMNYAHLRTSDINKLNETTITIAILKQHNLISRNVSKVKIYKSGVCDKKIKIQNLLLSKGAKELIQMAGGEIS
ncbi:50S ribosomal protein L15 [Nitrosomonas sp. JL21]|uniref:50S ribosomal protein L15 n=1 Tax=Nitrosomonas sp. JL21 TaxID=153949 RepID=UPI0013704FA5|nr:50S ribosomal protein L15 [Nitrosomonas sp. JL21]MBL8498283.1 50S ribosomal protein L15 [Nitrosomonas sp.]MXS77685.1 50S ribosomal protein L15 [Nitrosomonas sp. JL21]